MNFAEAVFRRVRNFLVRASKFSPYDYDRDTFEEALDYGRRLSQQQACYLQRQFQKLEVAREDVRIAMENMERASFGPECFDYSREDTAALYATMNVEEFKFVKARQEVRSAAYRLRNYLRKLGELRASYPAAYRAATCVDRARVAKKLSFAERYARKLSDNTDKIMRELAREPLSLEDAGFQRFRFRVERIAARQLMHRELFETSSETTFDTTVCHNICSW